MEFLYVFGLMFFAIFGAAMLAEIFCKSFFKGSAESIDVFVEPNEDLQDFVERARKSGFIGSISIIGGAEDEQAVLLAEKYDDVHLCGDVVKK